MRAGRVSKTDDLFSFFLNNIDIGYSICIKVFSTSLSVCENGQGFLRRALAFFIMVNIKL